MLYTKNGDDGTTGLFGTTGRISKTSTITDALGTLDELNAVIGVCRSCCGKAETNISGQQTSDILCEIQQHLFIVQAELAGADKHIDQQKVAWLEELVDKVEQNLEPVSTFLLPGANELSALMDWARTVSRRAERSVVSVADDSLCEVHPETLAYCNRLSSLLYAMVRAINDQLESSEQAPTYS